MADQHVSVVFVVDDEKLIAQTIAMILNHKGFVAFHFTNPLEALEHMKTVSPDLLISDVMMPQLSGIELAILVTSLYPKCKILLFSGQATTADLLETAREQGHDFHLLSKPIHPADLLREIEGLCESESRSSSSSRLPSSRREVPT